MLFPIATIPDVNAREVSEVFLDGKLNKAELVDDKAKSFGIFMHSLILSNNSKVVKTGKNEVEISGDENERAITLFTLDRGFDKNLIDNIAPKVTDLDNNFGIDLRPSIHSVNNKLRIVAKGNPMELIQKCAYVLMDLKIEHITRKLLSNINAVYNTMISKGQTVYAIVIKDILDLSETVRRETVLSGMTFVALVGIGKTKL